VLWLLPLIASAGSAVDMDWTLIGDPRNPCDPQYFGCYGSVDYAYKIGTYEVTNEQYAEFLNAKAADDPHGLLGYFTGGITRSGTPENLTYAPVPGDENKPVVDVDFFSALRFANWMNNGQGDGDTETGAYTLHGGTEIELPENGNTGDPQRGGEDRRAHERRVAQSGLLRPRDPKLLRVPSWLG